MKAFELLIERFRSLFSNINWNRDWISFWQRLIRNIVIALACVFLILTVYRVLFPLYRQVFAQDLTVEVIATGQHNEDSLYHNVRLTNVTCNGICQDLSKIPLDGNWEYSSTNDFLYNYTAYNPNQIVIHLDNAISVDFTFVSEVGSGIVQVTVNGHPLKPLDLYSNSSWDYATLRYDTSVFVHPEQHPVLIFLIFLLILAGLMTLDQKITEAYRSALLSDSENVLMQAGLALVIIFCCLILQFQRPEAMLEYLGGNYLVILEHYILIFLLLHLVYQISQSHWISFAVTGLVLEILNLVSAVKQEIRGTPLLPWDFQVAGAALSVVGNYDISVPFVSIMVIICTVIISISLYENRDSTHKYQWKQALAGSVSVLGLLLIFVNTTVFCGVWGNTSDTRVYQVANYYAENGFLVAFSEYINYLLPQDPPESYDKQTMEAITEKIISTSDQSQKTDDEMPNIIVIMSESFWDVTNLEDVTFNEDPLRVYRKLTSETMHGDLLSHVFGGNTVISEFECLTGFHSAFFPSDFMVYGSTLGDNFRSAASFLSEQGYYTIAMHPYEATNYNRNAAYQTLGFQEMIFEDDFPSDARRIRNYISDDAMYDTIVDRYEQLQKESDAPLFLFGITMQNHGGYWPSTTNNATQVDYDANGYLNSTVECMDDYFAGLRASDEALGKLISYFSQVEEDTIVIYFGDHMSDAGTNDEKMIERQSWYHSSTFSTDVMTHRVPYLVWSNCGIETGEQPIMDISMLMPSVLAQTNIRIPYFWEFLLDLQTDCRAFNSAGVVLPDLSMQSVSSMSQETQELLNIYELLTYDYVWGHRYAEVLWEIP